MLELTDTGLDGHCWRTADHGSVVGCLAAGAQRQVFQCKIEAGRPGRSRGGRGIEDIAWLKELPNGGARVVERGDLIAQRLRGHPERRRRLQSRRFESRARVQAVP